MTDKHEAKVIQKTFSKNRNVPRSNSLAGLGRSIIERLAMREKGSIQEGR